MITPSRTNRAKMTAGLFSLIAVATALGFQNTPGGQYGFTHCGPASEGFGSWKPASPASCAACCDGAITQGNLSPLDGADCRDYCKQIKPNQIPCDWSNFWCLGW